MNENDFHILQLWLFSNGYKTVYKRDKNIYLQFLNDYLRLNFEILIVSVNFDNKLIKK